MTVVAQTSKEVPVYHRIIYWTPTDITLGETATIYTAKLGERVLSLSVYPIQDPTAATSGTVDIGDPTDPDGFMSGLALGFIDADTPIDGAGSAYLTNSGGKLYAASSTNIQVVYTPGATPGAVYPQLLVCLRIVREWPG